MKRGIALDNPEIKIVEADCLEYMQGIADESIDLILCDPPYGKTNNEWDKPLDIQQIWAQYKRIIKPHGAIILFGMGRFTAENIIAAGNLYRYTIIWHKTTPTGYLNANRQPLRAHEDIIVCYKKQPDYHPQMTHGHPRKVSTASHKRNSKQTTIYGKHEKLNYDSTDRYPASVITFPTDKQKSAVHSTQKPVKLLEWLIRSYTDEGNMVLDNCMGSGSSAIACLNTGRSYIGIEKCHSIYETAAMRIINYNERGGEGESENID